MAALNGMETYASRLASFSIAQPIKRGSDAKGAKGVRWPHESPKAEQVNGLLTYHFGQNAESR